MKKISREFVDKVKEAVNIIEVIGEHVVLRKSGANHSGLCPFHQERTPSFSVSEQKQQYYCYGCKVGGDVVTFVKELHALSFVEAVEELSERARIPLPKGFDGDESSEDPEVQKRRQEQREKIALAQKLNRFVAGFYHQAVPKYPEADRYFRSRGADDDLMRTFYVGFAQDSWDALAVFLDSKKAPLELAVELGLIRPSPGGKQKGIGYFDLFRNRAMFPILDLRGKVAGFGGRAMPSGKSATASEGPKYMNSPESPLFQKSRLAFGLYQAQKFVREKDEVILVEGYFDVLALHAAGFQNVVATCGTSLTPEHLQLFKKFASRVTVLFDGDRAGIDATQRAMETGLAHGQVLFGAAMPEGLDPDEILFDQKTGKPNPDGREKMEAILKASHPLLDAGIDEAVREAEKGPEARTQALKRIGAWLGRFKDPVGREIRAQEVQKRLGVSSGLLDKTMGGTAPRPPAQAAGRSAAAPTRSRGPQGGSSDTRGKRAVANELTQGDRILLSAMVRGSRREVFDQIGGNLPPKLTLGELFEYPPARALVADLGEGFDAKALIREGFGPQADPQVRSTITEASVSEKDLFTDEEFQVAIQRGATRLWARFSQHIKAAMAQAEANKDAGLHDKLLKEYLDVQRKMKEFISFYDEA